MKSASRTKRYSACCHGIFNLLNIIESFGHANIHMRVFHNISTRLSPSSVDHLASPEPGEKGDDQNASAALGSTAFTEQVRAIRIEIESPSHTV